MKAKVYLKLDDQDHHGSGCDCGKCNSNGKSYGVAAFKFDSDEPVFVEYGPSEEAAMHNAILKTSEAGMEIHPVPEKDEE